VDRKTILAIVLSALVLLFVPKLLQVMGLTPARPAPVVATPKQMAADTAAAARARTSLPSDTLGVAHASGSAFSSSPNATARQFTVSNPLYDVRFDTQGARIIGVTLRQYKSADGSPVRLEGLPSVAVDLGDEKAKPVLADAIYETSDSTDAAGNVLLVRFQAADSAGMRVMQTYSLDPKRYVIGLDVRMDGAVARGISQYHVELQSWPLVTERNAQEDANNLQAVTRLGNDVFRHRFNDLKRNVRTHAGAVAWTAVCTKYFSLAVVPAGASGQVSVSGLPQSAVAAAANGGTIPARVASTLVLPIPATGMSSRLLLYAGPNDYWALDKIGFHLEDMVNLGWRWLLPFSRAILRFLLFLHQFVPNYGLVILLLSALVKLVFHPLTASSMKSMRAMQRIQPEIESLRKRYESDPEKLNKAVFALYRENKVNPVGGCLPLLIQMPVLFSLYQVFLHAIELRHAPFVAWINDLSAPDMLFSVMGFPIRILPVIMFGSAILQQRMTPTDPRQVQTMQLMNVFLLVLFYNLPSGLVLYWTITNLLTAAQQYLVTHGERSMKPKAA
jgi:YidC/Oxa1 family membrane protein insertase